MTGAVAVEKGSKTPDIRETIVIIGQEGTADEPCGNINCTFDHAPGQQQPRQRYAPQQQMQYSQPQLQQAQTRFIPQAQLQYTPQPQANAQALPRALPQGPNSRQGLFTASHRCLQNHDGDRCSFAPRCRFTHGVKHVQAGEPCEHVGKGMCESFYREGCLKSHS